MWRSAVQVCHVIVFNVCSVSHNCRYKVVGLVVKSERCKTTWKRKNNQVVRKINWNAPLNVSHSYRRKRKRYKAHWYVGAAWDETLGSQNPVFPRGNRNRISQCVGSVKWTRLITLLSSVVVCYCCYSWRSDATYESKRYFLPRRGPKSLSCVEDMGCAHKQRCVCIFGISESKWKAFVSSLSERIWCSVRFIRHH